MKNKTQVWATITRRCGDAVAVLTDKGNEFIIRKMSSAAVIGLRIVVAYENRDDQYADFVGNADRRI